MLAAARFRCRGRCDRRRLGPHVAGRRSPCRRPVPVPRGRPRAGLYAAVPVAVDAGLLHLLRISFFLDPPIVLPVDAEAALLQSPLFREVGEDLYEIDPMLRDALLAALVAAFGPERPARVAVLLEQYTDQHPTWHTQPELERKWFVANVGPPAAADVAAGPARRRARRDDAPSHTLRPAAVAELGELGLLPGADVRAIALQLERIARNDDAPLQDMARDILDTITRLVPPPPPRRLVEAAEDGYQAVPFPELSGIDPLTFDPYRAWAVPGKLTVPIGTDPDGRPVLLDLREPGHGGMGPHGLVIGATGSASRNCCGP